MYQRSRFRPNQRLQRLRHQQQRTAQGPQQAKTNKLKDRKFQNQRGGRGRYDQNKGQMNREASVTVKSDWTIIEEMDFPRLSKLSLPNVKEAEDL